MKKVTPKPEQPPKEKPTRAFSFRKFLPLLMLVVFSVAILVIVLPRLPKKPPETSPKHYQGVLEMWNVESFEGGSGSRQSWITSRAAQFEKTHEGLFVHVTTLNQNQLVEKLDNGETFDLICFSRGAGCLVQNALQPYTGSVADIRENILVSGQVSGKVYALPIYVGAYCLFARESQLEPNTQLLDTVLTNTYTRKVGKNTFELAPLTCGFTESNSPVSALALSGVKGKCQLSESVTQFQAYENFVANKTAVTLLGTQRDLYRLGKREENGKIEKLTFAPLCGYTDLVQYVGLSAACGDKTDSATEFMQFLVQSATQQTLVNINMFSVLEQTLYTNERYLACEQGLTKAYVPNVFGDKAAVTEQRKTALATLNM